MKRSYIIALIIVALSVGAIMVSIADSSSYVTFDTAVDNPGKTYHVIGKINFDKPFESNTLSFFKLLLDLQTKQNRYI